MKETNDRDITSTLIQYLQEHDESDSRTGAPDPPLRQAAGRYTT